MYKIFHPLLQVPWWSRAFGCPFFFDHETAENSTSVWNTLAQIRIRFGSRFGLRSTKAPFRQHGEKYKTKAQKTEEAEVKLLLAVASGKKTFEQVAEDANDFSLSGREFQELVLSNPARGITSSIEERTGFGKANLHFLKRRDETP